jgi:tetratricopeptide (TPR) repeat protein
MRPDHAATIYNRAIDVAATGPPDEALKLSEQAVRLFRGLESDYPGTYRRELAMAVNNHSNRLATARRPAEALAASQEAVDRYRALAADDRDTYLPDLAMAVNNHALRLAEVGSSAEALDSIQEAVDHYRELTARDGDDYLADLAAALWNVAAVALKGGGVTAEVLAAAAEGVDCFARLAADQPAVYAERHQAAASALAKLRQRAAGDADANNPRG